MAKISIYFPEGAEDGEVVSKAFLEMAEAMDKVLFPKGDGPNWSITCTGSGEWRIKTDGIYIARKLYRNRGTIYHSYFEIDEIYQNKRLSSIAMKASLQIADELNYEKAVLEANIDIGGYAWLRRGALPVDASFELKEIVLDRGVRKYPELSEKFLKQLEAVGESGLKAFVLSPEFQEYKPLFLKSFWQGAFDLKDPTTRIAMVEGAEAAFEYVVKSKAVPAAVPLTSNQEIANELVKTQMRSIAFARSLAKNNAAVLNETEEKVYAILTSYASKFEGVTDLRSAKARSLFRQLEKELIAARETAWQEVNKNLTTELIVYSKGQIATSAAIIQTAVPVILDLYLPSKTTAELIVNATPFQGRLLSEWLKRTQNIDAARITAEAVRGITQGLTPTQIARSVVGTQALNGVDGVTRKALRDMESLILTVTSGIQNEVRSETYKLNSDVFDKEYFIATLDIHTTLICAGNDGKIFKLGEGPMPPLHFRCRSLRGPYIDPDAFGTRPYKVAYEKQLLKEYAQKRGLLGKFESRAELPKGAKTDYDNFARARTRELVGKLPALTNFNSFLKMQSESFQDEYLGKARAAAFRRGEFNLENFTNSSGRVYTNTELGLTS